MRAIILILVLFSLVSCTKKKPAPEEGVNPSDTAPAIQTVPARVSVKSEDKVCKIDDDCEVVPVQCTCDCGEGINKAHAEKYNKLTREMCEKNPPAEVCKVLCEGKPKCLKNVCTYEVVEE